MSKLEKLKQFNIISRKKKDNSDPEQSDQNHGQLDDYDTDNHPGSMFLSVKKVLVDVPRKVDPDKLGIDLVGNIVLTGMDPERLKSLKAILGMAKSRVPIYMTQAQCRDLEEKLGDFDKVDEHIVKEDRDFDVNGVNFVLSKVKGSTELRLRARTGEEYHSGSWISKKQGVAEIAGPPPGPPPRYGLIWEPQSHRWERSKVDKKVNRPLKDLDVPNLYDLAPNSTNELLADLNDLPDHGRAFDSLVGFLEAYAMIATQGKDVPESIIDYAWEQVKDKPGYPILHDPEHYPENGRHRWAADVLLNPTRGNKIIAIDAMAHKMHERGSYLPHMLTDESVLRMYDYMNPVWGRLDEDTKDILEELSKSERYAFILDIRKTRGVPTMAGPPPGPPPREGLQWHDRTHRWVRPEELERKEKAVQDIDLKPDERVHRVEADFIDHFDGAEVEHAVAIDKLGYQIMSKMGNRDMVMFTRKESQKMLGAEEFIHNHPYGGGSFSFEDIFLQYQ